MNSNVTDYDLSPILTSELHKLYSIEQDKFGSMNTLYKYMYIRASINIGSKIVSDNDLINFILEELNISVFKKSGTTTFDSVIYKDVEYNNYKWTSDFIDNLKFRAEFEGGLNIKPLMEDIYKKGYRKAHKYRKLKDYHSYIKYYRLLALNEEFGINPSYHMGVEGFSTSNTHNPYKRSLEETLESIIHSSKFIGSNTTADISEEDLESFIVDNIELVEKGMRFVDRQVDVPGGIIDIVARDASNNICIIEIKINEDKSIIWQALHYPKEIKKKYYTNDVRMITVAPTYNEYILNALKEIDNVELLDYSIKVSMGNIENLSINKVN